MKYYVAYGSNLNQEQMKKRCEDAKWIGAGTLFGYRLLFRSHSGADQIAYLTIVPSPSHEIPIGIYLISDADEQALDRYEGVAQQAYRKQFDFPFDFAGNTEKGFIYLMNIDNYGVFSNAYYERVRQGYFDCGLKNDLPVLEAAVHEHSQAIQSQNNK